MTTIKKVLYIFSRSIKIRLFFLLAAIIFSAFLEMAVLAVISPFLTVLLDSSAIGDNNVLSYIYEVLPFSNYHIFLASLAFLIAAVFIFKSIYIFVVSKIQYRFLSRRQVELADRLLAKILSKSYLYHTNKNPAEYQRIIIQDVYSFFQLVLAVLLMISDFFMCFFITIFLLVQASAITFTIIALSLISVLLYFKVFRNRVKSAGEISRDKSILMLKTINQAVGSIKEMKILRRERYFCRQFKMAGDVFAVSNQKYQVYRSLPKLLLEAICFSGAFIFIGVLIAIGADVENTIPLLGVFVLGSFRLLPAISHFTAYVNDITFSKPSVDSIYNFLFEDDEYGLISENNIENNFPDSENEKSRDIVLRNVSFTYPNSDTAVFSNVSLTIPYGKAVAFIGHTGAGKTTLADVILGICMPQNGGVYYKGISIHHNFDAWSKDVGYIPQQIYLLDESIKENVAYGVEPEHIDVNRVTEVLNQAQLTDFIDSLPNGIETIVGDRGVRLSGGQRQRIGIARALYTNPSILVLDEATSSLDNETEKAVVEAVERFRGEKTLIIIAHRLSTIENCDIIYRVENGKVAEEK